MADNRDMAEDNTQQYLRQQMRGQLNQKRVEDLAPAFNMRQERYSDYFNDINSENSLISGTAQRVLDKNTQDMIDYYNYLQFEQEPQNLLERRATEQAVYTGNVPFGYEDSDYLGVRGSRGVLGTSLKPEVADEAGIPRQVYVAGNKAAFSQVPIHEGTHPIVELPKKVEEDALRALDYFRMRRQGEDTETPEKLLRQRGYDINDPQQLGYVRFKALQGAMSMTDEVYDSLSEEELEGLRDKVRQYEQEPGFIGKMFGEEKGFKEMMFAPYQLEEMSEPEFYKLLDAAPAFQFNEAESYRGRGRLYMTPQPAVQNYEFGGVAKPNPDRIEYAAELLRNTSPETFFSDAREALKMQRVEGREYGDLLPFVSRERVDKGPEGIDTKYYFDPKAGGIADTVMDKLLQLGEKTTEYFYPDADAKVQNYQNGGPVEPKQDDMFPDALKEGIGTLVEYAPKVAKVAGRGIGDLVRSDPVSPPELATEPPPADQLDFIASYSPVYSHNIPTISGRVVEQLYSPEQTAVNRADLFINPEKMGETAPRISKQDITQLLKDIRQQIDVQNVRLKVQGKEAGVTPSEELEQIFSQKLVADRLVDFIRNETGVTDPEQLQRMVSEIVMTTTSSMDPTEPEGMADGGVVSLKDRAVNMTRGPRSNGIMQYVPYITGATNGY